MTSDDILKAAMGALTGAFAGKAANLSTDKVVEWFSRAANSFPDDDNLNSEHVAELAETFLKQSGRPVFDAEMTRRNLARWFEIPEEEFSSTPTEQLEPEVLIRHIYLEKLFATWLQEWGYEVAVGEDLQGAEGIEYTPDVYGTLNTLHGKFQVALNLVCDNPPGIYRVRALLETIESYTSHDSEFGQNDIFILATPFSFGKAATSSITLQTKQEAYTVLKLEAEDLWDLQTARDSFSRQMELQERVRHARFDAARA